MAKQTNAPEDWRILAERDLAVADYLKDALVILEEEPPNIHDLDDLCSLAERHRSSLISIASLCTIITQFSSQPRYDRGFENARYWRNSPFQKHQIAC